MTCCACTAAARPLSCEPDDAALEGERPRGPRTRYHRTRLARRALAYHEAAHAVFALLGGGIIETATIVAGPGYEGIVRWRRDDGRIATAEVDILTIMAGPAAESVAMQRIDPITTKLQWAVQESFLPVIEAIHRDKPTSCNCTSDDCRALHRLLWRREHQSAASLRLDYTRAGATVVHMIRQPAVWRSISAAAAMLLKHGSCDHANIAECISRDLAGTHLLELGVGLAFRLTPILGRPAPENTPSPAPDHG